MVLTARRLLRFLVLGRSNSILRLRRARGRDRCLARPRRVALGAGAGSEKRRIDAARRWSGVAAERVRRFDDSWISAARGDMSYEFDRQNGNLTYASSTTKEGSATIIIGSGRCKIAAGPAG